MRIIERGLLEEVLPSSFSTLSGGEVYRKALIDVKDLLIRVRIKASGAFIVGLEASSNANCGLECNEDIEITFALLQNSVILFYKGQKETLNTSQIGIVKELYVSGSCTIETLNIYRSPFVRIYNSDADYAIYRGNRYENINGLIEVFTIEKPNDLVFFYKNNKVINVFSLVEENGTVYNYKDKPEVEIINLQESCLNETNSFKILTVRNNTDFTKERVLFAEHGENLNITYNGLEVLPLQLEPFETVDIKMLIRRTKLTSKDEPFNIILQ